MWTTGGCVSLGNARVLPDDWCAEVLCAAVRVGPWPVAALREILKQAGASEWTLRQAAASATSAGGLAMVRQHFWVHPHFARRNVADHLYVEGYSREQLIAELSKRARPVSAQDTVDNVMQGDDADRLARDDFARHHG